MSKINLTEEEKIKIGKQCCNCGTKEDLEYHHIVPLSMGGNNIISNICCLCYSCHSLIHFGEKKNINHSEATKAGLQRAKERGVKLGQPKGAKLNTKKSIEAKQKIIELNYDFNGKLSNEETYKIIGISRNTFYKYKRELMNKIWQINQYQFNNLLNKKFDFYVNNSYIIEFDGSQHFKYTNTGWDTKEHFERTHKSDLIKNKHCFEHNVPLIRIPYNAEYTFEDLKLKTTRFLLTPENEQEYYN